MYTLSPAGGEPSRLLTSESADYPAAVSPKGGETLVIRVEEEEGGAHKEQLRVVTRSGDRPVGPSGKKVRHPSYLPDGSAVVVEADLDGLSDLYEIDLTTGKALRLTTTPLGSYEPSVDPSGKRIAFVSSRDGNAEVYSMDRETKWVKRLTWSPEDDETPSFSPDGKTILFVRSRRGTAAATRMDAEGNHLRTLRPSAPEGRVERDAVFAPDGELVALTEQIAGRASVVVVRASDGSEVGRTEAGAWLDETPTWSPDGQHIAFVSSRDGDTEIYRMSRDAKCPVRLTRSKGADWLPRWVAQ